MSARTSARTCGTVTPVEAKGILVGHVTCHAPAPCAKHPKARKATVQAQIDDLRTTVTAEIADLRGVVADLGKSVQALVDAGTPAKVTEAPARVTRTRRAAAPAPAPAAEGTCDTCGKGGLVHNTRCRKCRKATA